MPGHAGPDGEDALVLAPWLRVPESAVDVVFSLLGLRLGDVFCDFGCGDGQVLEAARLRVPGLAAVVGIDLDPVLVLAARERLSRSGGPPARVVHAALGSVAPGSALTAGFVNLLPPGARLFGEVVAPNLPSGFRLVSAGWPVVGKAAPAAVVPVPPDERRASGGDPTVRLHFHRF